MGAAAAAAPGMAAPKFVPAQPGPAQAPSALLAAAAAAAAQISGVPAPALATQPSASSSMAAAQAAAMRAAALAAAYAQGGGAPAAQAAQAATAAASAQQVRQPGFETEIEINDFPQNARWKVTHKGFQQEITDLTGAAVTTKGIYVAAGERGQSPQFGGVGAGSRAGLGVERSSCLVCMRSVEFVCMRHSVVEVQHVGLRHTAGAVCFEHKRCLPAPGSCAAPKPCLTPARNSRNMCVVCIAAALHNCRCAAA
jgi:hypothetical protein